MINPVMLRWAGVALSALVLLACVYVKGRHDVQVKFNDYKAEVAAVAAAQEATNQRKEAKNAKDTQEAADNYRKQISVLRSYYANRLPNAGSGLMPPVSNGTSGADGSASYAIPVIPAADILAGQCAETTLMLTGLQGWINKVTENTND